MKNYREILEQEEKKEGGKPDVAKIIQELVDTDFGGSNEDQAKGLQLLKGLAFSEDPKSNDFMKKLNAAYTKIGKEVLGK